MKRSEYFTVLSLSVFLLAAWLYGRGNFGEHRLDFNGGKNQIESLSGVWSKVSETLGPHELQVKHDDFWDNEARFYTLKTAKAKVATYNQCLSGGTCGELSQWSESARRFALGVSTSHAVIGLRRWMMVNPEKRRSKPIEKFAREMMSHESPRVKEAAMDLLALFKSSSTNFQAVVAGVKWIDSATVQEKAKRFQQPL